MATGCDVTWAAWVAHVRTASQPAECSNGPTTVGPFVPPGVHKRNHQAMTSVVMPSAYTTRHPSVFTDEGVWMHQAQ